jgi:uncharacterized phage protein (TIGR01671 family)
MKEIKFRGKTIKSKRWVYGYYFQTSLTDEETNSKPEDGWHLLSGRPRHCISKNNCVYEIDIETLGEYINYKDLNEEELYIGDIIHYHRHEGWYVDSVPVYKLGVIAWNDSALGFKIQPIDTHSGKVNYGVDGEKLRTSHRIIKVGNLYESNIWELIKKFKNGELDR